MNPARPRLAVRAAILHDDRLLMVNAWPGRTSDLWCLPGGGVEPGQSLPENLIRELHEETGLAIRVGAIILINEFHDPAGGFHQVEIIFRATLPTGAAITLNDPECVVDRFCWVTRQELARLHHKPALLARAVWGQHATWYDQLEPITT